MNAKPLSSKILRAIINGANSNARQPDGKEMVSCWNLIALVDGEMKNVITARTYMGRSSGASVVYACVWIYGPNGFGTSGRGSAGGYGYHKESQAIEDAFHSAGVKFYGAFREPRGNEEPVDIKKRAYFGGTGDSYYEKAFIAAARAAGYRGTKFLLIHN